MSGEWQAVHDIMAANGEHSGGINWIWFKGNGKVVKEQIDNLKLSVDEYGFTNVRYKVFDDSFAIYR